MTVEAQLTASNQRRQMAPDRLRAVPILKTAARVVPRGLRMAMYDQLPTSRLASNVRSKFSPSEMDTPTYQGLVEMLREDTDRFAKLSGHDLAPWLRIWDKERWR